MLHLVLDRDPNIGEKVAGYTVNDVNTAHGRLSLSTSDGVRVWADYTVASPTGRQMGLFLRDVEAATIESLS